MRAYELDDFDNLETEGLLTGSRERGWLWFGLIVSLGLHLALCTYFYRTRFQTADAMLSEALPRAWHRRFENGCDRNRCKARDAIPMRQSGQTRANRAPCCR